jgi:hypothetical protein
MIILAHGTLPILIHRHEQEYNTFTEYQIATERWNDYITVGLKTESANDPLDTAALTMLGHVPLLADSEKYISASGLALNHSDHSTSNISLSALTRSPRTRISTFHEIDLRDSRLYAISTIASLNSRFVRDRRLWHCIAGYAKDRDTYMWPVGPKHCALRGF